MLALWFALPAFPVGARACAEDGLRSRIYHRSVDDFQKQACVWKAAQLGQAVQGRQVLEVFPADDINSVEIEGDETTFPSSLLLWFLREGRFVEVSHLMAVERAHAGRLWLKNGSCMEFTILLDPADDQSANVRTPLGDVSVPPFPDKCRSHAPQVKPGMTRTEVEARLIPDGGITVPFRYERYVLQGSACGTKAEGIKVNVAFKPAGMSDAVYLFGKWLPPKQSPKDRVVRVSPRYLEMPYSD